MMPLLHALYISGNKAEAGQTIPILANNLTQCPALQALSVRNMEAPAIDMEILAQKLPTHLTWLDISYNGMNDAVASHLVETLPHALTVLTIGVNGLSASKHNELLNSIHSKLTRLHVLGVQCSRYPGDLMQHAGQALVTCTQLNEFRLMSYCNDLLPSCEPNVVQLSGTPFGDVII